MSTKSIKGTQTEKLLVESYIAESTAYTRYTFYAKQAEKEQYYPIQRIFTETADNELHHAKVFFKFLEGGKVTASGDYDAGVTGTTLQNLRIAAEEERTEGVEFYTNAAKVAESEGFPVIAERFRSIAEVEKHHHDRFERYIKQVEEGTVWKREKPVKWQCLVCGYIHEGTTPPDVCPACNHPYQHYMALDIYDE